MTSHVALTRKAMTDITQSLLIVTSNGGLEVKPYIVRHSNSASDSWADVTPSQLVL